MSPVDEGRIYSLKYVQSSLPENNNQHYLKRFNVPGD